MGLKGYLGLMGIFRGIINTSSPSKLTSALIEILLKVNIALFPCAERNIEFIEHHVTTIWPMKWRFPNIPHPRGIINISPNVRAIFH